MSRRGPGLRAATAYLALAVAAGCAGSGPGAPSRPVVAASIPPLAWFVDRLAGDAVETVVLLPPGASPEHFEPSVHERRALERASLLVEVGHPDFAFEVSRIEPLAAERPGLAIVRGWRPAAGESEAGHDHAHDPHVWLSPGVARDLVEVLAPALARAVPGHADRIEANRAALVDEIEALDARIARTLAPFAGRRFFLFHPGWGPFAERYGLIQEAAEEHGAEPGPEHLARMIDRARRDGVRTVFVQPQFAERGVRTLAADVGAEVAILDPLARDWDRNLERAAAAIAASFR